MISLGKKESMFYENVLSKDDMTKLELFFNKLNVLFTRGKKSLSIYVNDIETYLYLNHKSSKLKQIILNF